MRNLPVAAGRLVHLWIEWGIQILVLVSFVLQVFLLVFRGIRRRSSSNVLKIFLWTAYLLADSTAIYTLGHLSVDDTSDEHQLVAFWAPFLLLHLGGPDNITAYALEDNTL
jgi:cytochrome c oxidase assembly factor CtaG